MPSSKMKTLYIFKYLNELSDESNPLSSSQLIELLKQDGYICERKSIYADVKALNTIGFDIVSTSSPKRGFFMASRHFELPEIRLLIDAVSSAGFITPNKTKELVSKLEGLVSKNQANEIVSQVYMDTEAKCDNEEIYYIIDALHDAINNKQKVKFKYRRRSVDKENKKAYTEKTFSVSPYALIWRSDHYYLVCNNQKYDNLMNLRLDRMKKIEKLDEPARHFSEVSEYTDVFDVSDYSLKSFNMYSGETKQVKLLCELEHQEEIMDRFGKKIPLKAVDTNHFETIVNAAVSEGFISWVMNFGEGIKVLEPQDLCQQIKEKAKTIYNMY